jgi:hypothetical protein
MSAWIVSSAHIDVLVNAAAAYDLLAGKDPQLTGAMLWRENHRSVNARYGEQTRTPSYRLQTTEATLLPAAVVHAVSCYSYQSCEHGGWEASISRKLCDALVAAAESRMSKNDLRVVKSNGFSRPAYETTALYNALPWGFERLEDATAAHWATVRAATAH